MGKATQNSSPGPPFAAVRACPLCGQNASLPRLQARGLNLVQCRNCSMVYLERVPDEFASGEFYHSIGEGYYLSPAKLESDYADVRFERELRIFRRHCPSGRLLDVGCSSGAFLFQLNKRFPGHYQVLGTDVSGAPLDYAASRGVPVERSDFLSQDWSRDPFDAVTFWAVLEHVAWPGRFVAHAATSLKPAGLCFVLVPNFRALAVRLLGSRYRYIYPQHLNYFTEETLRRLLQPHFDVIEVRSTHFNPAVLWQDWRSGGADVPNEKRAQLLKTTTALKRNPLLKPVKAAYALSEKFLGALKLADNLVLVARKKS